MRRPPTPESDDELAIFVEDPPRAVDFAPRAMRPGSRGRLTAAAWATVVVMVVGIGLLARESTIESPTRDAAGVAAQRSGSAAGPAGSAQRSGSVAGPGGSAAPHWPPLRQTAVTPPAIHLRQPAPAGVELSTARVDVEGSVLVHAARVDIVLQASGSRTLGHASTDVTDANGGIRPERAPTFRAMFDLPASVVGETVWVVVTAYDTGGRELGGTRRAISVALRAEQLPPSVS